MSIKLINKWTRKAVIKDSFQQNEQVKDCLLYKRGTGKNCTYLLKTVDHSIQDKVCINCRVVGGNELAKSPEMLQKIEDYEKKSKSTMQKVAIAKIKPKKIKSSKLV